MTASARRVAMILMCAITLSVATPAPAGHTPRAGANPVKLAADIGPDQAAAIVRDRTGGRVLGVKAVERDGRVVYQVKVIKNGYVRIYHVDGSSGNILG